MLSQTCSKHKYKNINANLRGCSQKKTILIRLMFYNDANLANWEMFYLFLIVVYLIFDVFLINLHHNLLGAQVHLLIVTI